jgi:hypothetical protein
VVCDRGQGVSVDYGVQVEVGRYGEGFGRVEF